MTDLIVNGTLERHPDLHLGIVELSSIWVPMFLLMLDGGWDFTTHAQRSAPGPAVPAARASTWPARSASRPSPTSSPTASSGKSGDLFMCCSDFPHSEGTDDPAGRLRAGGLPARGRPRPVRRQRPLPPRADGVRVDGGVGSASARLGRWRHAAGASAPDRAEGARHLARQAGHGPAGPPGARRPGAPELPPLRGAVGAVGRAQPRQRLPPGPDRPDGHLPGVGRRDRGARG